MKSDEALALTAAYMAGAEKARSEMQAEIDRLRAEVERLSGLFRRNEHSLADIANSQYLRAERLAEALRGIRRDALDGCSAMDCARDAFDVLRELDLLREQENDDA